MRLRIGDPPCDRSPRLQPSWKLPELYFPFHSDRNGRKISYRYEITPHSTSEKISRCFDEFRPFRLISGHFGRYLHFSWFTFLGFYFYFYFFLCSPSSFFFLPSSLSVTFLYFFSFVFLPKRRRRNGFWFKCHASLPSPFFFFLLSSSSSSFFFFLFSAQVSLSLCLFFTFFFSFRFKCRPSRDVIRYLFEIFIAFALSRVMHSSIFFFLF